MKPSLGLSSAIRIYPTPPLNRLLLTPHGLHFTDHHFTDQQQEKSLHMFDNEDFFKGFFAVFLHL